VAKGTAAGKGTGKQDKTGTRGGKSGKTGG
jgi:hypothetical protein